MFDVGFSEILLTSVIGLVVLGPEKLPKVARQVGNWMGRARVMARQLSEQLEREVNAEELLKQQAGLKPQSMRSTAGSAAAAIAPPGTSANPETILPPETMLPPGTSANPETILPPETIAPPMMSGTPTPAGSPEHSPAAGDAFKPPNG